MMPAVVAPDGAVFLYDGPDRMIWRLDPDGRLPDLYSKVVRNQ